MKPLIILLLLFGIYTNLVGQDDLYYTKPKQSDSTVIMQDIQYIQYCLGSYYKERQTAYIFAGLGIILSGGAGLIAKQSPDLANKVLLGAAITGLASVIVFYDSEKWLKKGSIKVAPTGIRITF